MVIAIWESSGLFLTLKVAGKRRFTITKSNQIQNIMNKIKNFDSKTAYVLPSSKTVSLSVRSTILQGSRFDSLNHTEKFYNDEEEEL